MQQREGALGADEPGAGSRWERLAAGVLRCRLPRWDCTIGAVAGREGLMVIDTGSSLQEGSGVRTQLRSAFPLPVSHIALTHPHFDHVLGTAAFAGAEVYGAVGMAELLARRPDTVRDDAVAHGLPQREADEAVDVLVRPGHAVSDRLTVSLGDRAVLLANVGPGHTGHDLAVLVPGSPGQAGAPPEPDVVFCGDLVEESAQPQAGSDAQPRLWPAAIDRLLGLGGADAVYVPGHGAAVDAAFLRAQRDRLAEWAAPGGDCPLPKR